MTASKKTPFKIVNGKKTDAIAEHAKRSYVSQEEVPGCSLEEALRVPRAIAEKLEAGLKRATEDGSFQGLVKQLGDEIHFQGGKEFEATWRKEWDSFAKITAGAQK